MKPAFLRGLVNSDREPGSLPRVSPCFWCISSRYDFRDGVFLCKKFLTHFLVLARNWVFLKKKRNELNQFLKIPCCMSLQRVSIIPVKEFNSVYSPGKIKGFTSTQIKQAFQQRVHQQHPSSRCTRGRSFLELSLECNCSQLHPCWNSHLRERLLPISPNCQPGKIKVTIIGNSWLSISRP